MLSFKDLITIDKKADTAVYLQISNSIIHHIRRGRLRKGLKLPGSRELAAFLHIHRKTMLSAYDELLAQGWIEMIPRKGTFVVQDLPDIKPKKLIGEETADRYPAKTAFSIYLDRIVSFPMSAYPDPTKLLIDDGVPDIRLAPTEIFLRELRSLSRQSSFKKYYKYGNPQGPAYLREILASFLTDTRGLPVSSENIMITKGAQMGIYLASSLLIRPGDHVIAGEPGYFGANLTFLQMGAIINRVPVDEEGIDADAIELLCKTKRIRLLYVIPHHHYPTTVTLTPERRIRLLELAARYKFAIIEDDYDYDFHYTSNPVLPMASLDQHGNVIYIGTLSKTLVPAIRIGFMVAPENLIAPVSHLRRAIDWQGDSMTEVAIAELYRNGTIGRHIKKVVKIYRERRDHFCSLLKDKLGDQVSFKIPDGGMSVWTRFPHIELKKISEQAARKGLVINDGSIYNTTVNLNASRLGFASLDLKEQDKAITLLAKCVKQLI
ncbi:MAG: PLP-dependent aminotransferase family protein [Sediminibacterium sp.]